MTADQSIIDNIILLRKLAQGIGGSVIPDDETPATDLDGQILMNDYLGEVVSAFGDTPTSSVSIVDDMTFAAAFTANLAKIVRCVT